MACDRCHRPLTTKADVVVWVASGGYRCFPCWIATTPVRPNWAI
jgi:hypothetical protein